MQEERNAIIEAILIVSTIFILVASFVVAYLIYFNKRKTAFIAERTIREEEFQSQLQKSQIEVQESTYSALSKELHDNIGQLLSSAKMLLGLTERNINPVPDTLRTANLTIGQAINELRSLSKALDKEWLEQFSFIENLNTEISRINTGGKIIAQLIYDNTIALPSDVQIILFRIVQEGMQNAIKHAIPQYINISVSTKHNALCIAIHDDGKGFTPTNSEGMGINNMKHRVKLLKGTITWESITGQGTAVHILLPLKETPL